MKDLTEIQVLHKPSWVSLEMGALDGRDTYRVVSFGRDLLLSAAHPGPGDVISTGITTCAN